MSSEALEPPFDREQILGRVRVVGRGETTLYERALLAEVARLGQAATEARHGYQDNLAASFRERDSLAAALAVAREREQRAVEKYEVFRDQIGSRGCMVEGCCCSCKEDARAALVDEPAAAIGRQAVDDYRQDLAKLAESQTVASVGQPPASAAADEPGETPA